MRIPHDIYKLGEKFECKNWYHAFQYIYIYIYKNFKLTIDINGTYPIF